MAKDSLSSDIDLIKEIEQLRLKQKLLIDALKKKTVSKEQEDLENIHAKLEFLVQIFKEEEKPDGDEDESEKPEDPTLEKLKSIETLVVSKFEAIENKLSSIETKLNSQTSLIKSSTLEVKKDENLNKLKGVKVSVPPTPEFKVEEKKPVEEKKEEKKGWFKK